MIFQPEADPLGALDPQRQLATQRATESPAAAFRRAKFERLTAGMLDQVEAAPRSPRCNVRRIQVNAVPPFASTFGCACDADAALPIVNGVRHAGAALCRRAWLFAGLLVAAVAPAHGFDDAQPVQGAAHELVLDSSGVPDVANWVVLDANGTAAWRAQGETQLAPVHPRRGAAAGRRDRDGVGW